MSVATTQSGTRACTVPLIEVRITGPLDMTATQAIRTTLDAAVALNPQQLVLALADCPVIDAAAIGLLLDTHRHLWRCGATLTLRSPTARVRHILRIARVDNVLRIEPDAEPAAPSPPSAVVTTDAAPVREDEDPWRAVPPPPVPSAFVRARGRARPSNDGHAQRPDQNTSE